MNKEMTCVVTKHSIDELNAKINNGEVIELNVNNLVVMQKDDTYYIWPREWGLDGHRDGYTLTVIDSTKLSTLAVFLELGAEMTNFKSYCNIINVVDEVK